MIRFNASDIANLCGLSIQDAHRAAQYLAEQGYFAYVIEPRSFFSGIPGAEVYELTEKGKNLKAFGRFQRKEYIKEHFIAILALIISIISIFVSVFK